MRKPSDHCHRMQTVLSTTCRAHLCEREVAVGCSIVHFRVHLCNKLPFKNMLRTTRCILCCLNSAAAAACPKPNESICRRQVTCNGRHRKPLSSHSKRYSEMYGTEPAYSLCCGVCWMPFVCWMLRASPKQCQRCQAGDRYKAISMKKCAPLARHQTTFTR